MLFPEQETAESLKRAGLILRRDCQFHWFNQGYDSFDAFLATFTAEKRKKAKRERRRVAEAGISFRHAARRGHGRRTRWELSYPFYADTFYRHGHEPVFESGFLQAHCRRACPTTLDAEGRNVGRHADRRRDFFRRRRTRYSAATGAPAATTTACISRPATTRASNTASRRSCSASSRAPRASTRCRAASCRPSTESAHYIADPRFAAAIGISRRGRRAASINYAAAVNEHVPYQPASDEELHL